MVVGGDLRGRRRGVGEEGAQNPKATAACRRCLSVFLLVLTSSFLPLDLEKESEKKRLRGRPYPLPFCPAFALFLESMTECYGIDALAIVGRGGDCPKGRERTLAICCGERLFFYGEQSIAAPSLSTTALAPFRRWFVSTRIELSREFLSAYRCFLPPPGGSFECELARGRADQDEKARKRA